jgi:hypothetical protein
LTPDISTLKSACFNDIPQVIVMLPVGRTNELLSR